LQPYDQFISSELLGHLGLRSTTFKPNAELKSRTATGYQHKSYEETPKASRPRVTFSANRESKLIEIGSAGRILVKPIKEIHAEDH
jgi:CubicO group peptidase (beta-lactamase class C family)